MSETPAFPAVERLPAGLEPQEVFRRLAHRPCCLFLDSALRHPTLGRYSFVAVDPFEVIRFDAPLGDPLAALELRTAAFPAETVADLPPFQGGAAGLFGYELGRTLERIPAAAIDEFQTPVLAVGLYDVVFAFDHQRGEGWIVSQGLPETDPTARAERARRRLAEARAWLAEPIPRQSQHGERAVRIEDLAPQYSTGTSWPELTSNFSREQYLAAVQRVIDYIRAGDVFQVNLAQRLLHPAVDDPTSLYLRLRSRNPATFASYFNLGDFQLLSASPERFVQVRDGQVETRPIKGTRRRTRLPEADLFRGVELQQSEKDRAENVMIVDLLRNDLARVCRPESVFVRELCRLESYEFVQHLVSCVTGELAAERTALDLLRAAFPGGSITGAPKVRAMEIIAEVEPTARGAYCGSLGYLGFDGTLDTSILIRTITAGRGWWQLPVGGGIVAQSSPAAEYEETWHKAAGLVRSLLP